ncbi:TnsD family Tn7-like transposition protein [Lysinibacillus capsici]|uniref:TnsD family Tn7-like transposition protein n=1 Tax=Lysinibacillus capsici TaxID=2115968 RepID=UPI001CD9ABB9|nr:TnsD family Tn7-like transposition protein [Lysinibacillus capsici]
MLTFFTDPYPNELLYSAIARYHFYSGNIDFKDTLEEVFSSRTVTSNLEIGTRIYDFVKNIGGNYSVELILGNYTIYPYYSPFLTEERQIQIINLSSGNGNGIYNALGMTAGSICKKDGIYYCSLCAKEDINFWGEPFIHREHQLQGIDYCGYHSIKLKKYAFNFSEKSRFQYIRLDMNIMDFNIEENEKDLYKEVQIKLAEMANQLFILQFNKYSVQEINLKYRTLLRKHGFIMGEGLVKQEKLHDYFNGSFPKGFLEKYESFVDMTKSENWLRNISRNSKTAVHPFRHLLLIHFLGEDIYSFMEIKEDKGPFGAGPWPCLNMVAKHYKEDTIQEVSISTRKYGLIGIFTCSCGFSYTRKGPDTEGENKYEYYSIYRFGEEWVSKLYVLYEEGYNLKQIAQKLNVTPKTVKNYLTNPPEYKRKFFKLDSYKRQMKELMRNFPEYHRADLYKIAPRIYDYLRVNDPNWFDEMLPQRRKKAQNKQIVNWEERDKEYAELIKNCYDELIQLDKPVRISKSIIGKKLGILSNLENQIEKLPRSNELLHSIIETVREYQYRRCTKIIDELIEKNETISLSKIRTIANITKKEHFIEIQNDLKEYINHKLLM